MFTRLLYLERLVRLQAEELAHHRMRERARRGGNLPIAVGGGVPAAPRVQPGCTPGRAADSPIQRLNRRALETPTYLLQCPRCGANAAHLEESRGNRLVVACTECGLQSHRHHFLPLLGFVGLGDRRRE
jgi:endogenous inhibitor of DNA gyrase (YacG/DUF329 family)